VKLVYVAGPYRGKTAWAIACNIHAARVLGAEVALAGAYPVIPHSNTSHMDGLTPDAFWLDGTLELMVRCDAAIFTPDWQRSSGARTEREENERIGRPTFDTIDQLKRWLAEVQGA
jgi:hypothetical protein